LNQSVRCSLMKTINGNAMKARLHFDLPEENAEFLAASRAMDLLTTLRDIDNLCRQVARHGCGPETAEKLAEEIRTLVWDELMMHA